MTNESKEGLFYLQYFLRAPIPRLWENSVGYAGEVGLITWSRSPAAASQRGRSNERGQRVNWTQVHAGRLMSYLVSVQVPAETEHAGL